MKTLIRKIVVVLVVAVACCYCLPSHAAFNNPTVMTNGCAETSSYFTTRGVPVIGTLMTQPYFGCYATYLAGGAVPSDTTTDDYKTFHDGPIRYLHRPGVTTINVLAGTGYTVTPLKYVFLVDFPKDSFHRLPSLIQRDVNAKLGEYGVSLASCGVRISAMIVYDELEQHNTDLVASAYISGMYYPINCSSLSGRWSAKKLPNSLTSACQDKFAPSRDVASFYYVTVGFSLLPGTKSRQAEVNVSYVLVVRRSSDFDFASRAKTILENRRLSFEAKLREIHGIILLLPGAPVTSARQRPVSNFVAAVCVLGGNMAAVPTMLTSGEPAIKDFDDHYSAAPVSGGGTAAAGAEERKQ